MEENIDTAIILADVYTRYFEPLDIDIPVSLLPVGNVPILEMMLHHLRIYKIVNVYIYSRKTRQISEYVKIQRFRETMNIQTEQVVAMDEVSALQYIFSRNDQLYEHKSPILLLNGPIITNINLYDVATRFRGKSVMVLQRIRPNSLLSNITAPYQLEISNDKDCTMLSIGRIDQKTQLGRLNLSQPQDQRQTQLTLNMQPADIYILDHSFRNSIRQSSQGTTTITDFLHCACACSDQSLHLCCYIQSQGCISCKIDSLRTYRASCRAYVKRYFSPFSPEANVFYDGKTRIVGRQYLESIVGARTQFGPTAQLLDLNIIGENCQIYGTLQGCQLQCNCTVEQNTYLNSCLLMKNVTIMQNCYMEACVIMNQARVEQNVVLPKGSIVGQLVAVTKTIVLNSIRAYLIYLWNGQDSQNEHLTQLLGLNVEELHEIERFMRREILSLSDTLIKKLPPIFLMKQQIRRKDMLRIRQQQEQPYDADCFTKYPLYEMSYSITMQIDDPDANYEEQDHGYSQSSDSSSHTTYDGIGVAFMASERSQSSESSTSVLDQLDESDSTEPAKLAVQINKQNITSTVDNYWIPNYLIDMAKEISNNFTSTGTNWQELSNDDKNRLAQRVNQQISQFFIQHSLRNGFCLKQNKDSKLTLQCIFSKQMMDVLDEFDIRPNENANNEIYFNNDIFYPQLAAQDDGLRHHIQDTVKARQQPQKQRVLLLPSYLNGKVSMNRLIFNQLKDIVHSESFQRNVVDRDYMNVVKTNLQHVLIRFNDYNNQHKFKENVFKTVVLLSLNRTEGLDIKDKPIMSKGTNKLTNQSTQIFAGLICFMCSGDPCQSWLVESNIEESERCNAIMLSLFRIFLDCGLDECRGSDQVIKRYAEIVVEHRLLRQEDVDDWVALCAEISECEDQLDEYYSSVCRRWQCIDTNNIQLETEEQSGEEAYEETIEEQGERSINAQPRLAEKAPLPDDDDLWEQ